MAHQWTKSPMVKKHLLLDKRFYPLFWTQFSGTFNDNLLKNAIVMLVAFKSITVGPFSAEQMVALCGGIFILPFFLFSAWAGELTDKYSKGQIVVWTKYWEVAVALMAAMGFYFESIYVLLVSLFMIGAQATFFGPAKYSLLPEILNDDELLGGNALVEMGTFVAILAGTIAGGMFINVDGSGPIYVSLGLIIVSVIGTLLSLKVVRFPAQLPELKVSHGVIFPTIRILKLTNKNKTVFYTILGISWFWFFGAILLSIFPVYVKSVLMASESIVTFFLVLFSMGVAIGSIACEKLSNHKVNPRLIIVGALGMGLFGIDIFFIGQPGLGENVRVVSFFQSFQGIRLVVDLFMISFCGGLYNVPLYTLMQVKSKVAERSRMVAANNIWNALFMVVASVLLVLLFTFRVSTQQIFLLTGIMNVVVCLVIWKFNA